jgi:hypothetical protein
MSARRPPHRALVRLGDLPDPLGLDQFLRRERTFFLLEPPDGNLVVTIERNH